jgi:hypothetical protein
VTPEEEIAAARAALDEAENLLQEWMGWWVDDDRAPAKLPKALHVRTPLFLARDAVWPPIHADHAPRSVRTQP